MAQLRAVHSYVALVCASALLSLAVIPWGELASLPPADVFGLLLLMAFALLSERLSVGMTFIPRGPGHTITFIPLLAAVALFGPAAPVLVMAVTGSVAEIFIRKKEALRATFNTAQYILATCLAGRAFIAVGGTAGASVTDLSLQFIPLAVFLIVFMGVNHGAVALAIALSQNLPFREVWSKFIGPSGVNAIYDILVSPIAIVVAFFYLQAGWLGLVLSLLPLLFIRHAYLNNYRLEQANRDLLRALVKAIETRDPYTSGHSQRVASLAADIARELNLSARRVDAIEMAALLHDIGKIDSVYAEILRKPETLTAEEWRIMESHVTKGVELLRSLASVPEEVIAAVKHHHEREDGGGYPMGVSGDNIPLGGKIIKVCDAVDAMMSDRPYRAALSISEVEAELNRHAGREFDISVVRCVVNSYLLETHAQNLKRQMIEDGEVSARLPERTVAQANPSRRAMAI